MWCEAYKDGSIITVKLTPRASRNTILGTEETWLRVALTAPPVDGKANEAARRFIAETLNLPRCSVNLVTGQTARLKRFSIANLSPDDVIQQLLTTIKK